MFFRDGILSICPLGIWRCCKSWFGFFGVMVYRNPRGFAGDMAIKSFGKANSVLSVVMILGAFISFHSMEWGRRIRMYYLSYWSFFVLLIS